MSVDMKFHAHEGAFESCDDELIAYAYFRSKHGQPEQYLILSRSLNPNELSSIYLEIDDQIYATQDGITRCQLLPDGLILELDEEAKADLGNKYFRQINIGFEFAPALFPKLREALSIIFNGHPHYDDQS